MELKSLLRRLSKYVMFRGKTCAKDSQSCPRVLSTEFHFCQKNDCECPAWFSLENCATNVFFCFEGGDDLQFCRCKRKKALSLFCARQNRQNFTYILPLWSNNIQVNQTGRRSCWFERYFYCSVSDWYMQLLSNLR